MKLLSLNSPPYDMNKLEILPKYANSLEKDGVIISKHLLNPYENSPWGKYYGFYLGSDGDANLKFRVVNDLAGHGSGSLKLNGPNLKSHFT